MNRSEYAKVVWLAEDVHTIRPTWTIEKCEEALSIAEKHLRDRTIEIGWTVLDDLLPRD